MVPEGRTDAAKTISLRVGIKRINQNVILGINGRVLTSQWQKHEHQATSLSELQL